MVNDVIRPADEISSFTQEWAILHNDHEKYERYSLLIKLSNVIIFLVSFALGLGLIVPVILMGVVWLQDGIWKTFQARMSHRILLIERYIKEQAFGNTDEVHFQLYSDWEKSPKDTKALVTEYFKNALRPTVAYPHAVLIFLQVVVFIFT